jgi:hypothetical protein
LLTTTTPGASIEAALLSQMFEIADQIYDSMLVIRAAMLLKYRMAIAITAQVYSRRIQ